MGWADDINSLTKEIMASHETRVKALGQLVADTHTVLDNFRTVHEEMGTQLRADLNKIKPDLAKSDAERLEQARAELQQREAEQKERIDRVTGLLSDLRSAHEEMGNQLRADLGNIKPDLAKSDAGRLEQVRAELRQRQVELKERIDRVNGLLSDLRSAHGEMSKQLRAALGNIKSDLAKSDAGRVAQALAELKQRQATTRDRLTAVDGLLDEYRVERERAAAAWQRLVSMMQGEKEMPGAAAEPEPEETPEEAGLNNRVFNYLTEHPDGCRMTELEEGFQVARIQMAQILKGLMDDNKIEKKDMLYFAI